MDIPEKAKADLRCGLGTPQHKYRNCQNRLKCCPYDIYDINESKNMMKTRMFYGKADQGEERLLNKIWITLNPEGLDKTVRDYPDGFFDQAQKEAYSLRKKITKKDKK